MELQRQYIERRDFPAARRGYDPDEVDRHLRQVAEAVEQLKSVRPATQSVSSVAAERVQGIVEAAEASAREIEERAREEAQQLRADADAGAREQLDKVEQAAAELVAHAKKLQEQADQVLAELSSAAAGVAESVRTGAAGLRHELDEMRGELTAVRQTRRSAPGMGEPVPAPTPPEPAAEPEPEPEPEPEAALPVEEIAEEPVDEPGPPDAEPEVAEKAAEPAREVGGNDGRSSEGARLIALNMALSGTPREETARYLRENFDLEDQDELLDEVYARAGS